MAERLSRHIRKGTFLQCPSSPRLLTRSPQSVSPDLFRRPRMPSPPRFAPVLPALQRLSLPGSSTTRAGSRSLRADHRASRVLPHPRRARPLQRARRRDHRAMPPSPDGTDPSSHAHPHRARCRNRHQDRHPPRRRRSSPAHASSTSRSTSPRPLSPRPPRTSALTSPASPCDVRSPTTPPRPSPSTAFPTPAPSPSTSDPASATSLPRTLAMSCAICARSFFLATSSCSAPISPPAPSKTVEELSRCLQRRLRNHRCLQPQRPRAPQPRARRQLQSRNLRHQARWNASRVPHRDAPGLAASPSRSTSPPTRPAPR